MTEIEEKQRIVDVRLMPPPARHPYIFKVFDEMKPDETLLVVVDHDPVHLVQFMKHERRDFDSSAYKSYQKSPGEWIGVFRKKTHQEALSKILFTSFEKEKSFDASSFLPVLVYTSKDYKVILAYFKAGQFIPVHTPGIDLVLLVHNGRGEVVAGEQKFSVKPGDIVVIPQGERRGIRAITDLEVLHLVSPPPNDSDHEEVARKISTGTFV